MISRGTAPKVLATIALIGELCEAAILAPNSTTSASSNVSSNSVPTPTSTGLTNEQLAGALAAALAGNGGSFGSFGDLILGGPAGAGDPRQAAPPAAWAPAALGSRPKGLPYPTQRPSG
jgi:hypothetical protein